MAATSWFEMAMDVLPSLPFSARAILDDGRSVGLTMLQARDGTYHCSLSSLDARVGLRLTIPVETSDRGGYSVGCEIAEVYFLGALDSAAQLHVTEVRRRKPYRTAARVEASSIATLYVLASEHHPAGELLIGRVVDASPGGLGLTTDSPLAIGDQLRIDTVVHAVAVHAEVAVVQAGRPALGRHRVGCQFTRVPLHTEHALEDAVRGHAA